MQDSERLAIAAHLHVLLRRRTGRVIDTEWMVQNNEYAQEILRLSRARAIEGQWHDLAEWAERFAQSLTTAPPQPVIDTVVERAARALHPHSAPSPHDGQRYVGRLR